MAFEQREKVYQQSDASKIWSKLCSLMESLQGLTLPYVQLGTPTLSTRYLLPYMPHLHLKAG
jgi:hypothetical protein